MMTEEAKETTEETTKKKVVKVFQSTHCEPCHEIVDMINKGKYILDVEDAEVQVIDVTSEEGFPELEKEDVDALPSAKYEGKTCRLGINREEGIVTIDCAEVADESQGPGELGKL